MKQMFFVLAVILLGVGCQHPTLPPTDSVGGVLPAWVFYQGHTYQPKDGVYEVYYSEEIALDPQLTTHLDQVLATANAMTGGMVTFVRTESPFASVLVNINPHNSLTTDKGGDAELKFLDYTTQQVTISIPKREYFLTNIPLHEIGHFLFGPVHSPEPDDIMNPNRTDYNRMTFSPGESAVWRQLHSLPAGSTP